MAILGAFYYCRPDEWFTLNATVTGGAEDSYLEAWLCDGRPGFPIRATSGSPSWAISNTAKEVGILAVCTHAARSLFFLLLGTASAFAARQVGSTRAQRGDLTGMQEAEEERTVAMQRRRTALAVLVLWLGLLLLPVLTPWPSALYSAYALLWLLPGRRRR